MTIIIFMAFMLFVAVMETASKRHYLRRILRKAYEIYVMTYACILCWTGNA